MKTFPWFNTSRFFLFITPLAPVLVTKSTLFPFIVGKYVWFRVSVALALIFFLLGILFESEEGEAYLRKIGRVIKTPLGLAIAAFTAIFLVAGFLGIRPSYSFWSNFERGEGGLQMIHLFLYFFLLAALFVEEKHWRTLFWIATWSAFLVILYGVAAGLGYSGFVGSDMKFGDAGLRFQGSIGNPAYFAAYVIFSAFYAVYLLCTYYRKQLTKTVGSWTLWLMLVIYGGAFLLAATRGALLGLGAGIFITLAYCGWKIKSWRKWAASIGIVLAVGGILFVSLRNTEFVKSIPGSRIFDISFSAKTFEHRTIMWKIAWDSFKERPLLGWGPENFGVLFQKNFNPAYFKPLEGFGSWFDRAHNVFFDYLASVGILGTLAYVSIFGVIYWNILRQRIEKNTNLSHGVAALALAIPTAYLVQGLVLFDILPTYLNLFMLFGFMWYLFYGSRISKS
ncbi:MAG: O-antigen ligase family protein [bacterium]|nr:O-antigen ligase family protein [bacterium]